MFFQQVSAEQRALVILLRINTARKENVNATVRSLMSESGLSHVTTRRTISRRLKEAGFGFYQDHKKGLLTEKDLRIRLKYAKDFQRYSAPLWTEDISFYLDFLRA